MLGALLLGGGCGDDFAKDGELAEGSGGAVDDGPDDDGPTRGPVLEEDDEIEAWACLTNRTLFRGEWTRVIHQVLPDDVEEISIGGELAGNNFGNRGSVVIRYGEPGRVLVDARPFATGVTEDDARQSMEGLRVRATTRGPSPELETDCVVVWKDKCAIRVVHDGNLQPQGSGADLIVTVPEGWPGRLRIETETIDLGEGSPLRADICVDGLSGFLEAELDTGRTLIRLDDDIETTPGCEGDDCLFGFVRVLAADGAANVVVDTPDDLWTRFSMNTPGHNPHDVPESSPSCAASFERDDVVYAPGVDPDGPNAHVRGIAAAPPDATESQGFEVTVHSESCFDVATLDVQGDCMTQEAVQRRGDLRLCAGCLDADPCASLLE
ncbi:MAG: hypothetical protein AAGA54_20860 [Myxococcota bacterium]